MSVPLWFNIVCRILKMEISIRGAGTSTDNEGEGTAIKGKVIIICEIMFGKVTLTDVMLNLTVTCSERKGFSFG